MISERGLKKIQVALRARWDLKRSLIVQRAHQLAGEQQNLLIQEAYAIGYREGYWDGVVDIVDLSTEPIPDDEEIFYNIH